MTSHPSYHSGDKCSESSCEEVSAHALSIELKKQRILESRKASRPIFDDLALLGYKVESIYDLGNAGHVDKEVIPVLVKHLEIGGYPDLVTEGLGVLLQTKETAQFWDRLLNIYHKAKREVEKDAAAGALAKAGTKKRVEEFKELLKSHEGGSSRIFFVKPISQYGGEEGRGFLAEFSSDPIIGKEVCAVLSKYKSRDTADRV
jgi:hypothetical protein